MATRTELPVLRGGSGNTLLLVALVVAWVAADVSQRSPGLAWPSLALAIGVGLVCLWFYSRVFARIVVEKDIVVVLTPLSRRVLAVDMIRSARIRVYPIWQMVTVRFVASGGQAATYRAVFVTAPSGAADVSARQLENALRARGIVTE